MYTKTPSTSGAPTTHGQGKATTVDQFDQFADKAADKVLDVAHHAEQFASRVAEQGHEAGEKMK